MMRPMMEHLQQTDSTVDFTQRQAGNWFHVCVKQGGDLNRTPKRFRFFVFRQWEVFFVFHPFSLPAGLCGEATKCASYQALEVNMGLSFFGTLLCHPPAPKWWFSF